MRRELNEIAPMLSKTIIAAFVVASGDALHVDRLKTRRAVIGTAASALSLAPLATFAELKKASDAEIYARADAGKLKAAKVLTLLSIQRCLACSTLGPATPCVASLFFLLRVCILHRRLSAPRRVSSRTVRAPPAKSSTR